MPLLPPIAADLGKKDQADRHDGLGHPRNDVQGLLIGSQWRSLAPKCSWRPKKEEVLQYVNEENRCEDKQGLDGEPGEEQIAQQDEEIMEEEARLEVADHGEEDGNAQLLEHRDAEAEEPNFLGKLESALQLLRQFDGEPEDVENEDERPEYEALNDHFEFLPLPLVAASA